MTTPDYLTLLLYVAGIFVISTLSAGRTSSQKDMFSAGRQSPWWASGLSGFMTMFSAGTFVVWGGIAYELGFVAVMINTCYGIAALLVGYFVAGRWNELRIVQIGARTWVYMNGNAVVDNVEMENFWNPGKPLPVSGPILLESNTGAIRFRNIWVRELSAE